MICLKKTSERTIKLIDIDHVTKVYPNGTVGVEDINIHIDKGEFVFLVGSSGSGKSLLAHAILGILPYNAKISGNMKFQGELLDENRIKKLRGSEIAFVPQSTMYLDPLMKVGKQVRGKAGKKAGGLQKKLFARYGLPENTEEKYPFECSGGMTRRILLSTALMGNPKLIIADEPTPGMELELAKKSMEDFRRFADEGNGVLLITHDIELALQVADRIVVFYAGKTVEEAPVADFRTEETLRHPYTKALWRALPQNGFTPLAGTQPYVKDMPEGCPFGPRCSWSQEQCKGEVPMVQAGCGSVRCVRYFDTEKYKFQEEAKS